MKDKFSYTWKEKTKWEFFWVYIFCVEGETVKKLLSRGFLIGRVTFLACFIASLFALGTSCFHRQMNFYLFLINTPCLTHYNFSQMNCKFWVIHAEYTKWGWTIAMSQFKCNMGIIMQAQNSSRFSINQNLNIIKEE